MTTQDIKPGYKQSPLGLIPNDWEYGKIIDNFDVLENFKKNKEEIPYLEIGDVDNTTNTYTLKDKPSVSGAKYVPENVLLISTVRPNLKKITITKSNLLVSSAFATIKLKNKYLFHYVQTDSFTKTLLKLSEGGTYPTVSADYIYNTHILVPKEREQEKIAKILDICDKEIIIVQNIIDELELRNKGLEQKLLKNDTWKEIKMKDIFERVTDKNSEGNTNVITISAQKGFVKQNDFFNKFVASETLDNYYLVKKGEFCYNKSYSNGYPMGAIKRLNDFEKAVVTTLYICFKIKDTNKTSGDFFEYYFDAGILDKGLTQIAYEGGRAHGLLNVSVTDFFNLKIKVPEFEEQKSIANILNKANNQLNLYKQKLEKLQELKKGLMQQLLTGKVRVKEFSN